MKPAGVTIELPTPAPAATSEIGGGRGKAVYFLRDVFAPVGWVRIFRAAQKASPVIVVVPIQIDISNGPANGGLSDLSGASDERHLPRRKRTLDGGLEVTQSPHVWDYTPKYS